MLVSQSLNNIQKSDPFLNDFDDLLQFTEDGVGQSKWFSVHIRSTNRYNGKIHQGLYSTYTYRPLKNNVDRWSVRRII